MLRDIVYTGDMENHKYEVKNYKTKKCTKVPKEEHIIVRNTHEPIISRSDFEHVQELIKHRQRPSRHNHPNLFKGILNVRIGVAHLIFITIKEEVEEWYGDIDVLVILLNMD